VPGNRDHLRQLEPASEHDQDARIGTWAKANDVKIAYTPGQFLAQTASTPD
jgi:hypothetical protein